MRILIVDTLSPDSGTGPPVFVRNLVEGVQAIGGHEMVVMHLTRGEADEPVDRPGARQLAVPQAPFLATVLTPLIYAPSIRRRVREVDPDIIDLQSPELGGIVAGLGIPVASTVHGLVPEQLTSGLLPNYKRPLFPLYRRNWWKGLRASDLVLCLTEHDAEYVRDRGLDQVAQMPLPRSERYFTKKREAGGLLVSVGILGPRKNQLAQLEIMEHLAGEQRDATLRIIGAATGEGDQGYGGSMAASLESRGLQDRVELVGSLPNDEIVEELRAASVFVHTSTQETLPGAIVEAMASGTPVVAMDNPGTRALVRDGRTGFLVPAGSMRLFAERCGQLLADPSLRSRMGAEAREVARNQFSAEAVARARLAAFERLIEARGS